MDNPNYTILVVDDEELIRRLVTTILSNLRIACITATNGVDALNKIKGNQFDAVITDIKMPEMDGIILTREIAHQYPGLPVMVMTGFDEEYSAGSAISVGAREFIKKPFSIEEFSLRLQKMLGESETLRQLKVEKDQAQDREEDVQDLMSELEATLGKEIKDRNK